MAQLHYIKEIGRLWTLHLIRTEVPMTKPGSIIHLLHGPKASEQSINIKFGKLGETLAKEIIKCNLNLELLKCGVQVVSSSKSKDIDLQWANHTTKTIYMRELKGNMQLDTEKLPATFKKVTDDLLPYNQEKYPDYTIDIGILNWSVYDRHDLCKYLQSHIIKCEENGVKVNHMGDFLNLVDFPWSKNDFHDYFRELGRIVRDN
jgi:hypothetical protein